MSELSNIAKLKKEKLKADLLAMIAEREAVVKQMELNVEKIISLEFESVSNHTGFSVNLEDLLLGISNNKRIVSSLKKLLPRVS